MNNAPLKKTAKGPEFLADLMDQAMQILQSQGGHSPEKAAELAMALVTHVADTWGGDQVRIPTGRWNGGKLLWFQLAERDWQIYREYTGTLASRQAICARYGISQSRLYQIIAACRAALRGASP